MILVRQVHPAHLEIPDQGVILGHPEHLEIKVRREILVLQDQQGNGDSLVHLVLQGLLVMWEPRDHLDLLVLQDNQEMQGLQDEMARIILIILFLNEESRYFYFTAYDIILRWHCVNNNDDHKKPQSQPKQQQCYNNNIINYVIANLLYINIK